MSLLGVKEPYPRRKTHKTQDEPTYIQANRQIQNKASSNLQQDYTYIHNQHHQQRTSTKLKTPPITKHNIKNTKRCLQDKMHHKHTINKHTLNKTL